MQRVSSSSLAVVFLLPIPGHVRFCFAPFSILPFRVSLKKKAKKEKAVKWGIPQFERQSRVRNLFFFFLSLCVCVCVCVKQSRYFENPWQTTRRATLCQLTALRRTHSVSSYLLPLLLLFLFALITTSYIYIYIYVLPLTHMVRCALQQSFFFFPYTRQWRM